MATARLSPAASLLRNSKLFALPSAVPLPPQKASSDVVPGSNTATTIYPTRAATETPLWSLNKGDWGLKRPLPVRSTTKSGTPVIRLRGAIDTAEHIADFESAGDHVVTLQKWQDLNVMVVNRPSAAASEAHRDRRRFSVFYPELDNTTTISPTSTTAQKREASSARVPPHIQQALDDLVREREAEAKESGVPLYTRPPPLPQPPRKIKRWRYEGPWLAGMTDIQFDEYLKSIEKDKAADFRTYLRAKLAAKGKLEQQNDVSADGTAPNSSATAVEITDREVDEYLRHLRNVPEEFGPHIAAFLDLPEGPDRPPMYIRKTGDTAKEWFYSRNTVASELYKNTGPPRTHPSAGFSYSRTWLHSVNDPERGPRAEYRPVPARVLKDQSYSVSLDQRIGRQSVGVGGIVARLDTQGLKPMEEDQWKPQPDGTRITVKVNDVSIQQNGALEVGVRSDKGWKLDSDQVPYSRQDGRATAEPVVPRTLRPRMTRMVPLDQKRPLQNSALSRAGRQATKADEDTHDLFTQLNKSFGQG